MDEKLRKREMRRKFSGLGWALFIYGTILNAAVLAVCAVDAVLQSLNTNVDYFAAYYNSLMSNGWGYFLAAAIGFIILLIWKGGKFCFRELWSRGRPMEFGDFRDIFCLFVGTQFVIQILCTIQEAIFNTFGLSMLESMEAASGMADTFSLFLYGSLLAPIAEEILFRGLVLRTLMPYGKRLAIILSAFLFGIFHGNMVQFSYAFLVGLVLGYVAAEYSIAWAMMLHMFNNLVLSDMLDRLTMNMGDWGSVILVVFMMYCAIRGAGALIFRRREVKAYIRENPVDNQAVGSFFTAPGVLVLTVVNWLNAVSAL